MYSDVLFLQQESKITELRIQRVSPYRRKTILEQFKRELLQKLSRNNNSVTATVEFLNYTLQKADQYEREAQNLTGSLKNFKTLLDTDRKNFIDDSKRLKKAQTMAGKNITKLVMKDNVKLDAVV